ncbi:MAG: hypothetical protein P8K68_05765 [Algibacter sp.]|uniref:hypothetical protein n=1 Tax=Algibacter sp. TaxID=1872428 RepID=UPI00262752E9|nr:hypothetical protein [Algibacter sp.]MDG1731285.1 hypothetical protein [Algibacter sp.]MDG2178283.1 hypothetical protein [Algibacter sp.]
MKKLSLKNLKIEVDQVLQRSELKSGFGGYGGYSRACSFWDIYYSVGAGLNQSAAYATFVTNLGNDLTAGGMGANCIALGSSEYSDIGVVHYYTMAFCCT